MNIDQNLFSRILNILEERVLESKEGMDKFKKDNLDIPTLCNYYEGRMVANSEALGLLKCLT